MFSEEPPILPAVCGRTGTHLCLVHGKTTGESVGQDHLCLTPGPKASAQTLAVNLWLSKVKKVGKCPLTFPVFPVCNKTGLFSLSLKEAVTHVLHRCSALCLGRLFGGVTPGANVTTGLCFLSCVVTKTATYLGACSL